MANNMMQTVSGALTALKSDKLLENPVFRQLGVMVGVALSVALGLAMVLWSQAPSYSPVFANLPAKDAPAAMEALQQAAIPFKLDPTTGVLLVPTADMHAARMRIAAAGLPRSDTLGFELLQQETSFSTSRALEAARFQRALEGELARSIASLAPVESARVHLAAPKQSVFVRDRKYPTASVVLKLRPGRPLDQNQIESIVHLVASSVPELTPEKVSLVDQQGRLLNQKRDERIKDMELTNAQFDYAREVEQHYRQRIQDILSPIVGSEGVRAQVAAEVDFSVIEKTQESFNPDQPALRSEQTQDEEKRNNPIQGIPGALTNQPPAAGNAPEQAKGAGENSKEPVTTSKRATRNYDLDKTVSYTRMPTSTLRRVSAAVVVDDRIEMGAKGRVHRVPRPAEEIARLEALVREAIGYDPRRGDSVQVVNAAFESPAAPEPLNEGAVWEQPWFWDLARQAGGVLLLLILVFGVLRPAIQRLAAPAVVEGLADGSEADAEGISEEGLEGELSTEEINQAVAALPKAEKIKLQGPESYDVTLDEVRQLVRDDPKRVVQVLRLWLAEAA